MRSELQAATGRGRGNSGTDLIEGRLTTTIGYRSIGFSCRLAHRPRLAASGIPSRGGVAVQEGAQERRTKQGESLCRGNASVQPNSRSARPSRLRISTSDATNPSTAITAPATKAY